MSSIDDLIARRLRKLKGEEESAECGLRGGKPPPRPEKTAPEQVEELLERFTKEVELEEASGSEPKKDIDSEIRRRLERLKAETADLCGSPLSQPGNRFADAVIQMSRPVAEPISDEDPGELPWCVLCNADAAVRCFGCDGDLYCSRCFQKFHDVDDPHRFEPFEKK